MRKPTEMQAKALELIRQGKTPRSSMLAAGYTKSSAAHPSENLLRTSAAQSIIEAHRAEYSRVGIIPSYYVAKVKDLMEAEKVHSSHTEPDRLVPDWNARGKGLEFYRKDVGLDQDVTLNQFNVGEGGKLTVTWDSEPL